MANWRTRGAVGLTAALSLGLLISTTSGFSQADDRLPDVVTCEQFAAATGFPEPVTVQVPAGTVCALSDVALPGDLVVQPGAALTLTSATVAGTITADGASRLLLTDVSVAGAVLSTAAGTVPGPDVPPIDPIDPIDPAAEPVVPPVIELVRVDGESTIDLNGTTGDVLVAGTDLLGHLALTDTTGTVALVAADRPVDPAPTAVPPTDSTGTAAAPTSAGQPDSTGTAFPTTAAPVADLVQPVSEVELPPVRNLVGTDLNLTRTAGTVVIDGTTVTGRVRLEGNSVPVQFGPAATVAGGVVEVEPEPAQPEPGAPTTSQPAPGAPAPADPDPVGPAPTAEQPAPTTAVSDPRPSETVSSDSAPSTTAPSSTGTSSAAPSDDVPDEDVTDSEPTDGAATTDRTTGTSSSTGPATSSGNPTSSAAPAADDTDAPATTSVPGRPALPAGLTVDFGSSALIDLGSLRPVAGILTATGSMAPVALTDTRDGAPGWSVSAQLTDFAGGNRSFGAGNLGWTPKLIDGSSGAEVGPAVAPGGDGLSVNRRLGSAAPGEGSGTTVFGADLQLQLPVTDTVEAGTYTATLTLTVLS